jgi:hypothetical protein
MIALPRATGHVPAPTAVASAAAGRPRARGHPVGGRVARNHVPERPPAFASARGFRARTSRASGAGRSRRSPRGRRRSGSGTAFPRPRRSTRSCASNDSAARGPMRGPRRSTRRVPRRKPAAKTNPKYVAPPLRGSTRISLVRACARRARENPTPGPGGRGTGIARGSAPSGASGRRPDYIGLMKRLLDSAKPWAV